MANFPNAKLHDLEEQQPQAVQEIVSSLKELHDLGKPKTDEEVEARIEEYFKFCERSSMRPGIESLCLALHITRQTLFRWNRGEDCSERRMQTVQSAKAFVSAFIEQASLSGKLNPATGIFLMKNWLDYKDSYSLEQAAADQAPKQQKAPDLPGLERKYLEQKLDQTEEREPPKPDF